MSWEETTWSAVVLKVNLSGSLWNLARGCESAEVTLSCALRLGGHYPPVPPQHMPDSLDISIINL